MHWDQAEICARLFSVGTDFIAILMFIKFGKMSVENCEVYKMDMRKMII